MHVSYLARNGDPLKWMDWWMNEWLIEWMIEKIGDKNWVKLDLKASSDR